MWLVLVLFCPAKLGGCAKDAVATDLGNDAAVIVGINPNVDFPMLAGMLDPSEGTAAVCGFDPRRDTLEVKRRVGFVPESGAVFESLTGLEYLEMIAALYEIPPRPPARASTRMPPPASRL